MSQYVQYLSGSKWIPAYEVLGVMCDARCLLLNKPDSQILNRLSECFIVHEVGTCMYL